jgi:hypothetical protein
MPAAKPTSSHAFRQHVAFRGDQKEKCKRLSKARRLSGICQKAVDDASEIVIILMMLVVGMASANVPEVGDNVELVLMPGLEFTRYIGEITDITDSGIGIKPDIAYRNDRGGFVYIVHYNNSTNHANAYVLNDAIAYIVIGDPVVDFEMKLKV